MTTTQWVCYALLLVAQNLSFTFVSRARNSGSLRRHLIAALISNAIWFAAQIGTVGVIAEILVGKKGTSAAIVVALGYTFFTCLGSLIAHYIALRTERGKSAVGASAKYAQITVKDWEYVKRAAHRHYFDGKECYLFNER